MLTFKCDKSISDELEDIEFMHMPLYQSEVNTVFDITYSENVIQAILKAPVKVKNIDDSFNMLPPIVLNELSKMLSKSPLVTFQQFIVKNEITKSDYGKQIIVPLKTLNDSFTVSMIDKYSSKFDCVLLVYPVFQNPYDESCYMVTIMNKSLKQDETLTNTNNIISFHQSYKQRSKSVIDKVEMFDKFAFNYLRFLLLAKDGNK